MAPLHCGAPAHVKSKLEGIAGDLHVDELMVLTVIHDHEARLRSYELLADSFGLTSAWSAMLSELLLDKSSDVQNTSGVLPKGLKTSPFRKRRERWAIRPLNSDANDVMLRTVRFGCAGPRWASFPRGRCSHMLSNQRDQLRADLLAEREADFSGGRRAASQNATIRDLGGICGEWINPWPRRCGVVHSGRANKVVSQMKH